MGSNQENSAGTPSLVTICCYAKIELAQIFKNFPNSSSPLMASCKCLGVIRFTFKSFEAFPANSRTVFRAFQQKYIENSIVDFWRWAKSGESGQEVFILEVKDEYRFYTRFSTFSSSYCDIRIKKPDFGGQVLQNGGAVDGGGGTDSTIGRNFGLEVSVNATDGKLESRAL